jgi:hypothetical protein
MHTTATTGAKNYAMPGTNAKSSTLPQTSQQGPSRPASAAPNVKVDADRAKTPSGGGEGILNVRDDHQVASSLPTDTFRRTPVQSNLGFLPEGINLLNAPMRGHPGTNNNHGYMPAPPYFSTGMNMHMASQQAYAPAPQMPFYAAGFNPNAYTQSPNTTRPNSAIPKYQPMDPKYAPGPHQLSHPNASPQLQNTMSRRPSNYFVSAPSMSPVQATYAPRGWLPGNGAGLLPGPLHMSNGSGSMPPTAMYQPGMLTTSSGNPPLLTPPGAVPQPNYPGFAPPPAVPNPSFGYPTPPDTSGVVNPDIPPAIPSVYPDPAYSNINNCIYNPKGTTNVYIRGLRPETTDDDLLHMVRVYGTILSTKAIIDTQTKLCKG